MDKDRVNSSSLVHLIAEAIKKRNVKEVEFRVNSLKNNHR